MAMIFHPKEAKELKEHSVTRAIAEVLGNANGSKPQVLALVKLLEQL